MNSRAGGNALNTLLVRGRHMMISTFVLTQKLRACGTLLRVNAGCIVLFRLRKAMELETCIEELAAIYSKKTLMEMYKLATAEPYSFWYINLAAHRVEDMFWKHFTQRMIPTAAAPAANAIVE